MQGHEKTQKNGGSARQSSSRKQTAKNAAADAVLAALREKEQFEAKEYHIFQRRQRVYQWKNF